MGLTDRDYFRGDDSWNRRKSRGKAAMSVTIRIVILNAFLWFANGLLFPENNFLTSILLQPADVLYEPARWYTLLTSGFVHSPAMFYHILFNMVGLLIFGYGLAFGVEGNGGVVIGRTDNIEWQLGRVEYFLFYIFAIIFSSLSHAIFSNSPCLGASGGVTAIVVMYAFLFPRKTILVMFVIPMPMWVLGLLIVANDMVGITGDGEKTIAYAAHLGGAMFALLYYYFLFRNRLSFTGFCTKLKNLTASKPKRKTGLKTYNPDEENDPNEAEFEKRLDQILDRYGQVGDAGLTDEERKLLKEASQKYRNKNK
ncbi:MAG: rhomboid family intramembrane serine protease [Planctomycetaceae bacterium]|jgi:membrane associated rhomboid family serine protease|nr:rhomboid family intramembrane serine protease [Planctomycetaceae bacterium]